MSGIIIFVFIICSLLALLGKRVDGKILPNIILIILIFLAGFRLPGADYGAYTLAYERGGIERLEPSFSIISEIARNIYDTPYTLFVIYAVLGVSINVLSIKLLSSFFYLSMLVYLSNFFILHELIQIRAGVAAGILLLSIKYIYERDLLCFMFLCGMATLFHYSSVIFIPVYFLSVQKINRKLWCSLLIVAIIFGMMGMSGFVGYIVIEPFAHYITGISEGTYRFGVRQISEFAVVGMILIKADKIAPVDKYFIISLKIYMIGCIARLILFPIGYTLADRVGDIYLCTEVLLIPMFVYFFQQKVIGKLFIIGFSIAYLCGRYYLIPG
jgi:hypothetical protein